MKKEDTEEKGIIERLLDGWEDTMQERKGETVNEAYGMTNEEFSIVSAEYLSYLLASPLKTKVMDKIFSEQTDQEKAKIFAFARAFYRLKLLEKHGGL